jgi:hypothetical protein
MSTLVASPCHFPIEAMPLVTIEVFLPPPTYTAMAAFLVFGKDPFMGRVQPS